MTSINSNYNLSNGFRIPNIGFKSKPAGYIPKTAFVSDGYVSNPLYNVFGTQEEIEEAIKTNPRIQEILREYKLSGKVNIGELEKLKAGHLQDTRITAAKIYSNLPSYLKEEVNPKELQEAAMFHDYGKVLIPEKILNKNGELNEAEWAIMQQHSELGAELLKNKNLSPRAKELVKYHHQNRGNEGYPMATNYEYGLDSEILSVADRFGALTEQRSYKPAMPKDDALAVIEKDVNDGVISKEVFEALKKSV